MIRENRIRLRLGSEGGSSFRRDFMRGGSICQGAGIAYDNHHSIYPRCECYNPAHHIARRRTDGISKCKSPRRRGKDLDQRWQVDRFPITRSSRSWRAMARGATSGARRCVCSMRRWRRPTAANARSTGWKCTRARNRSRLFQSWLPDETTDAFKEFLVGIKGPLTTPIGGGIRSLNVALRKILDLYVCQRPVRWYQGRAFAGEAS